DAALTGALLSFLAHRQPPRNLDDAAKARLLAAMPRLKERAKTLAELDRAAEFLFSPGPPALDTQAEKILSVDGRQKLAAVAPVLQRSEWTVAALEALVRALADEKGLKLGDLAQPLRAALTGKAASPPIFDMM